MMVVLDRLSRRFGPHVTALDELDLCIAEGEIVGLLGSNGAGKSTTLRILATLLMPTSGRAIVGGQDVVKAAAAVRRIIGFSMQDPALAPYATVFEQLMLMGRLHGLSGAKLRARIDQLLASLDLAAWRQRQARTLSGGLRRRADLACALLNRPPLLLLDEPSAGLDLLSRAALWQHIAALRQDGISMLLSTHYLDEAERLCDRIAIVHAGRLLAEGTPRELKARHGAPAIRLRVEHGDMAAARAILEPFGVARLSDAALSLEVNEPLRALSSIAQSLSTAGIVPRQLELAEPTLQDVLARLLGMETAA